MRLYKQSPRRWTKRKSNVFNPRRWVKSRVAATSSRLVQKFTARDWRYEALSAIAQVEGDWICLK
ncbi:hypothetical protein [uncultured Nostoc sp.]|uniref:hypothetical protein n=1 Tax=uncultured Nostoc sp. TaxID=340711 RepID=UPI0035CA451D